MRRLLFYPFALFLSAFVTVGCSNINETPVQMQTYDLSDITDSVELNLSDLLEDIRIVPLETDSSFFIKGNRIVVSDKYIITLSDDAVHQFDALTGKHVRKLAVRGRGPNEYLYIGSGIIDDARDILYFSHQLQSNILVVNLQTGRLLPSLEQKKWNLDIMAVLPDGNICTHDDSLMFSILDVSTGNYSRMIDSLVTPAKNMAIKLPPFLGANMGGISLLTNHDKVFFYYQKFNDTVYQYLSPSKIEKVFAITHKNKFIDTKGIVLSIPYISDKYVLSIIHNMEVLKDDKGNINGMSSALGGLILINKDDNSVKAVSKILLNSHTNIKFPPILSKYGGFYTTAALYAQSYDAYELKQHLNDVLTKEQLKDSDRKYLEDINSKITESSNPVVIIGKRKK